MTKERDQRLGKLAARPTFRTIDGLSIRFVESEPRPSSALLLSPWPESAFAYEPTWSRLAEQTHPIAIDLPGFGRSERREALMSPRAMGEFIARAADAFASTSCTLSAPTLALRRRCSLRPHTRIASRASSSEAEVQSFRSNSESRCGNGCLHPTSNRIDGSVDAPSSSG